ncbi:hypothetical protein EDB80DRAFT_678416 [Ilyonectria destructans]|nr:hypothetical protein EDB80DRAFT_678416 [Ilyonectria destructans]
MAALCLPAMLQRSWVAVLRVAVARSSLLLGRPSCCSRQTKKSAKTFTFIPIVGVRSVDNNGLVKCRCEPTPEEAPRVDTVVESPVQLAAPSATPKRSIAGC